MLTDKRVYYRPFEYPTAYNMYRAAQMVHWTKDEIRIAEDLQNWNNSLTDTEKNVIGGILKGFTQMEVMVGDYWRNVANWFPKPEIAMMASAFSYFESIHQDNYAMINETLGLDDFMAFLYDEDTKNKIDYFLEMGDNLSVDEMGLSLAVFSAFAEGCMLFSSFAVLLSFQKENLLKGVGQIVSFSIRDENLHSNGGCWLFNLLCDENKNLRENIKEKVIESAKVVYELERKFINSLFLENSIRTLTPYDLKQFIKFRINNKLKQIGYDPIFDIDLTAINRMQWFDSLSSGREFGDFFAVRTTEYTNVKFNPGDLF